MIAGIDEAGKGPVLGPMCVAGILLNEDKLDELVKLKVKDSKQLTSKKREALAVGIKKLADCYFILEVSPFQIDELRKIMTMNEIMVACFAKVIEQLKPEHVFVDAADVNAERFGKNVGKKYLDSNQKEIGITSEHCADEKYPIVSAASILAKVHRDELVKILEKNAGVEIGSGYPGDPKTIKFLDYWIKKHGSLPDFARSSWETAQRLLEKNSNEQKKLSEYRL